MAATIRSTPPSATRTTALHSGLPAAGARGQTGSADGPGAFAALLRGQDGDDTAAAVAPADAQAHGRKDDADSSGTDAAPQPVPQTPTAPVNSGLPAAPSGHVGPAPAAVQQAAAAGLDLSSMASRPDAVGTADAVPRGDPADAVADRMASGGQGAHARRGGALHLDLQSGHHAGAAAATLRSGAIEGDATARTVAAGTGDKASAAADTPLASWQATGPGPEAGTGSPPPATDGSLPSLGPSTLDLVRASASGASQAPAPAEASPSAQAHLTPAPGTPAFVPALGVQLSTWLRDGVQHATLELNPQTLGPIDVRIAVKDGQTQVALAADVVSTRQALTQALPQLAAALGDVGLSLSGGSVSDQGRGSGQQASDGRPGSTPGWNNGPPADAAGTPASMAPVQATTRRGLLDLVA
jgi:flagellar hook-length control protein FliK